MFENHKKGEIGELEVTADLMRRGYNVFEPVSQNSACDLVVENVQTDKFSKVQVKSSKIKGNKLVSQFRRKSLGGKEDSRTINNDFDVGAIYCPELDKCFYAPRDEFGQSLTLRLESDRNMSSIRWAEDFTEFPY